MSAILNELRKHPDGLTKRQLAGQLYLAEYVLTPVLSSYLSTGQATRRRVRGETRYFFTEQEVETDVTQYFEQLKARMADHGISGVRLAKEMNRDPSQISRWFRLKTATLRSIQQIEAAIDRIIIHKGNK